MKRTISILLAFFFLMGSFGCQTASATSPPRSFRVNSVAALKTLLNATELSDAKRAQIEDIVTRKTGIKPENVVISSMQK